MRGPGWCLAVLLSVACGGEEVTKPKAPDMSALVAVYDQPDGDFDEGQQAAVQAAVADVESALEQSGVMELLEQALDDIEQAIEDDGAEASSEDGSVEQAVVVEPKSSSSSGVEGIEGDGYIRVTRICPGWTEPSVPDEANGQLEVIAGFTEEGFDPVIWGDAEACQALVAGAEVLLQSGEDHGLRIHLGNEGPLVERPLIVALSLRVTVYGDTTDLETDFRVVLEDAEFEYRVDVGSGSLLVTPTTDGMLIRAANGVFRCDDISGECELSEE